MNDERGNQWYTNKDLFEMMNEIKLELIKTQEQMKKYNDLRRTLNDVMESQKTLTEIVHRSVDKVNNMEAAMNSRRETFKDSKEIVLLVIAVVGWLLTLIGFFLK